MTDVWKSLPKKFCEICKVWYADNKISVENHERGLKHKSMVQQRLKDISRNAEKKDQERSALQYTLMQMETAALASVKGGNTGQQAAEAAAGLLGPQPRAAPSPAAERKKEAKDEAKERKRKLQELKKTAKKSQLWSDDADAIQWVKTETEDGQVYYWNIFSGETQWDAPGMFYTMAEYNEKYAEIAGNFGRTQADYSSTPVETETSGAYAYASNATYSAYQIPSFTAAARVAPQQTLDEMVQAPPPPREEAPTETQTTMPSRTNRWDKSGQSSITINVMKTEPKQEPEEQPVELRPEATSAPTLIAVSEPVDDRKYRAPKADGVLGPWVPVERKKTPPPENKPKIMYKDLPEPEAPPETTFTFDPADTETMEVTFEEKKAPVANKKAKVVEFKKRKVTARNIRAREEEDD